ncbi:unnamed protein product [Menidia menidia]|uniref:(Atlantic silverside) hypothetical protein n=1 Tax=Menidia menidia TaxID=238744 RepID=A0A8S4AZ57_9TELE|nr:unnamed protein product [Menidia menidia]
MSGAAGRSSSVSSVSSISLMEIKAETNLVLQAFLEQTLSTPQRERPGRVGGAYVDANKYRSKSQSKRNEGWDSQAEDEEEKKIGLKELIKQLPYRSSKRHHAKGSLERDGKAKPSDPTEDGRSPSSSSGEEDNEKKRKQKQMKIKHKLSTFFKRKTEERREKKRDENSSKRHLEVPTNTHQGPAYDISPPSHSPEFYCEVAGKLEKIARRSTKTKKLSPLLPSAEVCDKEVVIQQLVQVLSLEGDSMNAKIQSDPFLRNQLARLSYASFSKVVEGFSSRQVSEAPALPPSASPTLRRMAVSMEASRRIVTATGAQRLQGHALHYMETFVPWVKSHGGWASVVDIEEPVEYD